jgi:hypothetical protein
MTELSPYHEDQELDNNTSDNIHFRDILEQSMSRRSLIAKTASGAVALALASTLTGCNDSNDDNNNNDNNNWQYSWAGSSIHVVIMPQSALSCQSVIGCRSYFPVVLYGRHCQHFAGPI